jgi:hypothetical protein
MVDDDQVAYSVPVSFHDSDSTSSAPYRHGSTRKGMHRGSSVGAQCGHFDLFREFGWAD